MKEIKGILLDIGGVLYVGDSMIDGANIAISKLQAEFPVRFITNTTRRTPETIRKKLQDMGFLVEPDALFTALDASKQYILSQKGSVYTVLTDEAESWFTDMKSDKPDFVLVGDAYINFDFKRLNDAFRALENGAELIAAAKNRYFRDVDGRLSMDAGGFIAALEYAADTKAKIIGKPSKAFFHLAVDALGLQPEEVLMVGDDIYSDIKGAQDAGLKAALVKTGKFQPNDLKRGITPDLIVGDVTELSSVLLPR